MPKPLIVSIGMPRAGSGWHYNLIHDLVVATGGEDAHLVRKRFLLGPILSEVNCNIGAFTLKRLIPVMIPALLGKKYVIKAHAGPTPFVMRLINLGQVIPIYIYRDPRDALLSAFEYGKAKRDSQRAGAFSELITIEQAIEFMVDYVRISEQWLECKKALPCRYEDLLLDYSAEVKRLSDFLNIDQDDENVQKVIAGYQPKRGSGDQKGTHFKQGLIGRYKDHLSEEQKELCLQVFGPYLDRIGNPRE